MFQRNILNVKYLLTHTVFSLIASACLSTARPPLSQAAPTLITMFPELLLALVIGGLVFFLVQRSRSQVLKTEDGWWGVGAPPDGGEDVTIHPFEVTTSDEELEVPHQLLFIWGKSTEH